jgi:hypothetical protein
LLFLLICSCLLCFFIIICNTRIYHILYLWICCVELLL